jgi:hypothetical protein
MYRFLATAAALPRVIAGYPDRLGSTAVSALAVDRNLEDAADFSQAAAARRPSRSTRTPTEPSRPSRG